MKFREVPKERLRAMVPESLMDEVRRQAYVRKMPEHAVVSTLLCVATGIDPSQFGLTLPSVVQDASAPPQA